MTRRSSSAPFHSKQISQWIKFKEYIKKQDIATFPRHIYFSLGYREARTKAGSTRSLSGTKATIFLRAP